MPRPDPQEIDRLIERILDAAVHAGAKEASYVLLRLPSSVKDVFTERIKAALPLRAEKILHDTLAQLAAQREGIA